MLKYGYVEEDSAKLISIIGIFNTIGMVGLGWLGDQPWVNVTRTYGVCLVCKYNYLCIFFTRWYTGFIYHTSNTALLY